MNNNILYPFPKITTIYPEDLRIFIKNEFIKKFGEGNLIDVKVTTYPNEYSADIIISEKDEAVLKFASTLRHLFVDNGLSVILLVRVKDKYYL